MSLGENIIFLMVIRTLCVVRYVFHNDTDTKQHYDTFR